MQGLAKVCFVLTLCVIFTAMSSAADRRFEKKFSGSPGGTLRLNTDVGSVTVTGSSSNEISIVAEISGSEREVSEFEITADQTSSGVDVRGRGKGGRGFWGFGSGSNDLDIRYTIAVPREYNLDVNTSGGNVSVSTIKGTIRGGTSGGNIDVVKVEGPINMRTSGGNLHAEEVTGKVAMETSGGNVDVASVTGDVDVSTSGGNIRLGNVDGVVRAETSGGDVVVRLKNVNKGIHVETSGGSIEVAIARNSGANIDASTSGGDVSCDLPITMTGKISESRIRGTVNGGGATVRAHTSGGDIRIIALD
jgi:uncharacterized protein involved in outer membrane biogenesis